MFCPQQGTMDEMVRQYVRFAVGQGSISVHEPRLRMPEPNLDMRAAAHQYNHHLDHLNHPHAMMKLDEPQNPRVFEQREEEGEAMTIPNYGKSTTRRRRRTSITTNETPAERNKRLTYMRERRKQRIELETTEQKAARLFDTRERARIKLKNETLEEREKRLKYLRDHQRERIKSETQEERQKRLVYLRERQKERLRNETLEQREKRLSRSRQLRKPSATASAAPTAASTAVSPVSSNPSEPELNVDIREEMLYIRNAQCQVILAEPHPQSTRDPLDLHDYHHIRGQRYDASKTVDNEKLTIGRVWSLKPNTGVDDKLWYHNQL